jgi:hydrogenase maturation protein HypF
MVDNKAEGPAIGVAFDGTGYGSDGTLWGGEFLVVNSPDKFHRVGHLEYAPLLGGEAAIKKPYRMALSYIWTLLGEDFPLEGLPLSKLPPVELDLLKQQLARGINCPPTSSAGRLFDAVSAIAGVRWETDYEAQAAIDLEMLATDDTSKVEPYPFSIAQGKGMRIIALKELLAAVVQDVRDHVPTPIISLRFHHTMARITAEICKTISRDTGISQVALSGGVFQNRLLLRLTKAALEQEGFTVLTHRMVPTSDGGISLGQAVVANFKLV